MKELLALNFGLCFGWLCTFLYYHWKYRYIKQIPIDSPTEVTLACVDNIKSGDTIIISSKK